MQEESETFWIFSGLYSKGIRALDELYLKEIKLGKLGASKTKIDAVKGLNNLGQSSSWSNWFNN